MDYHQQYDEALEDAGEMRWDESLDIHRQIYLASQEVDGNGMCYSLFNCFVQSKI